MADFVSVNTKLLSLTRFVADQPDGCSRSLVRRTPRGALTVWLCQSMYFIGPSADTAKSRYPNISRGTSISTHAVNTPTAPPDAHGQAIVRWAFQSLPRLVGFTLELCFTRVGAGPH